MVEIDWFVALSVRIKTPLRTEYTLQTPSPEALTAISNSVEIATPTIGFEWPKSVWTGFLTFQVQFFDSYQPIRGRVWSTFSSINWSYWTNPICPLDSMTQIQHEWSDDPEISFDPNLSMDKHVTVSECHKRWKTVFRSCMEYPLTELSQWPPV